MSEQGSDIKVDDLALCTSVIGNAPTATRREFYLDCARRYLIKGLVAEGQIVGTLIELGLKIEDARGVQYHFIDLARASVWAVMLPRKEGAEELIIDFTRTVEISRV